MSDEVLEQISEAELDDETGSQTGTVFLLKFLAETWGESGKAVVQQVLGVSSKRRGWTRHSPAHLQFPVPCTFSRSSWCSMRLC
eukprot:XP_001698298.1 predicted protein [Chlamydomonas reinhardtii]